LGRPEPQGIFAFQTEKVVSDNIVLEPQDLCRPPIAGGRFAAVTDDFVLFALRSYRSFCSEVADLTIDHKQEAAT
jgi:hypothetical protein